jgi:hypothetical protein
VVKRSAFTDDVERAKGECLHTGGEVMCLPRECHVCSSVR